jgi:hypothetical protein
MIFYFLFYKNKTLYKMSQQFPAMSFQVSVSQPTFQPSTPNFQPSTFQPPSFQPPSFQPLTPSFQPSTPSFQPLTPSFQPSTYQPSTPNFQPSTYQPSTPSFQLSTYQPSTPSFQPPSFQPPTYQPPTYQPQTPSFQPQVQTSPTQVFQPQTFQPSFIQSTAQPSFGQPSTQPSSRPTFQPVPEYSTFEGYDDSESSANSGSLDIKAVKDVGAGNYENGLHEIDRLLDHDERDILNIKKISQNNKNIAEALRKLIKGKKLYFMDLEHGVATTIDIVTGYKGNGILLIGER